MHKTIKLRLRTCRHEYESGTVWVLVVYFNGGCSHKRTYKSMVYL